MKVGQNLTISAKIKVVIADELTRFMDILTYLSACISPLLPLMIISLTLFFGLLISCTLIMTCSHFLVSSHLHYLSLCNHLAQM